VIACPDETQLGRFLDGVLSLSDAERVELHADACEACLALLADVVVARSGSRPSRLSAPGTPLPVAWSAPQPASVDVGRRYRVLDLLGQGGMGRVYRAVDRLTGRTVAVKSVLLGGAPVSSTLRGSALAALAQEFRVLATLRHPNVIAVLDYGFDRERRPFFSMELVEGARPLLPYAGGLSRDAQVDLLGQLLRALGYLHRRGILHRDLKPSNILVTGGGALKVVDFGLATGNDEASRARAAGTLLYMAPELLQGGAASEASDLHAFGVVAFEMLAGRHPYGPARTVAEAIARITGEAPDLSLVPPELRPAVGWALERSPGDRPKDAATLLRFLSAAAGLPGGDSAPARDSFLVAARFTGRDDELGRLREALAAACAGRGSAWLVGGESGVGKSRLLEELRGGALVDGVLVVRGQALPGGGTAFHVWQGVLEALALQVELSALEASVLGLVLPNLGALLDREVPPPPELDVQATRIRLLRVLREVIERTRDPMLILLEDLQWADEESLALLAQISADLVTLPLLLLGTYRGDEAPRLPARLSVMRTLHLPRFDRRGVERLCGSMLGPGGTDAGLVDRVARETEGNAFFVVEVLRALAEEWGGLGDVGRREIPARLLAGGVEQVFARRLSRVPAEAATLLRLAAVAGRRLDLQVLARHAPRADADVQACADAGVLEAHEQGFRFSHDKLRERILDQIDARERMDLHARVAGGLEAAYPRSAAHAAQIAYHHREAGQAAPAARFYALAGETALAHGAPAEAGAMLEQARSLHARIEVARLDRVRVWRGLAQARYAQGRLHDTDAALRQVFALAGAPLPEGALSYCGALATQIAEHAARSAGLARWIPLDPRSEEARALRAEMHLALTVGELYLWLYRPEMMVLCTLRGLNLEAALGARDHTNFRAAMAFVLSHTPLTGLAARYLDRAAATAARGTQSEIEHLRIRAFIHVGEGRWRDAARAAEEAVSRARVSRDDHALMRSLLPLHLAQGELDDYAGALGTCIEMEQLAARVESAHFTMIALLGQAFVRLRLGELAPARAVLDRARAIAPDELGPVLQAVSSGLAAVCAMGQGQRVRAEALAAEALDGVRRARTAVAQTRYALVCSLEVYLSAEHPERHAARIRPALAALHRIARRFSFGEPNAWMLHGRVEWLLEGRRARAEASLRRSLRSAERLGSRFEQAQARYWLGRLAQDTPGRGAAGAAHLHAAATQFEHLGCAWEAARARAALGQQ
jgi:hypothetical protein